jgi:hypothetical protein
MRARRQTRTQNCNHDHRDTALRQTHVPIIRRIQLKDAFFCRIAEQGIRKAPHARGLADSGWALSVVRSKPRRDLVL